MNSFIFLRRLRSWLAFAAMMLIAVGAAPAQAQVVRAFGSRFGADVRGDIVLTGNTVVRPISTTATINNSENPKYVDVDGDASTVNSSSAQLKLPAGITGANILWARLYWSGRYNSLTPPATQTVKFSASGAYGSFTATPNSPSAAESQLVYFNPPGYTSTTAYVAWADVTTQMKAAGATPILKAGNLGGELFSDGLGDYAGWTVVAAYRNSSDTVRQLRVFDGLAVIAAGGSSVSTTISGFRTPDTGAFTMRFGSVVNEGDQGLTGDSLQVNGFSLSDAVNPATDYFNSTVSQDGTLFTGELNPGPQNSTIFGMDADRTSINGPSAALGNSATSANLTFTTSGDTYFPTTFTTSIPTFVISGRVFEDPNYGGGAGRAFDSTKGMAGTVGTRVELYDDTTGAFLAATTTDSLGFYYFYNANAGRVRVRVVNSSVLSNRGGTTTTLVPVQTFRTDASGNLDSFGSGTPADVTNKVGGESPATVDPAAGAAGGTLPVGSESVTVVTLGDGPVANVNFGFNFDTVVNTNDTGQGSLRQFVLNANALLNTPATLSQQGLTAGTETSVFMIPSGVDPLGRPVDPRFAGGVAKITLASTLQITGANANATAIDGTTQTRNIGDTNAGTFGTGGTVGVGQIALPTLARPEIEIYGPRTLGVGLDIEADNTLVKGVALWGFGGAGDSDGNAAINVGTSASTFAAPTISGVLLGTSAVPDGTGALVIPANNGSGDLIRTHGVDGGTISNSIIGFNGGKGIALRDSSDGWTVTGNEVRNNSRDNNGWDGIDAQVSGTQIIANLFFGNGGNGIDTFFYGSATTIRNNTSRDNGQKAAPGTGEGSGIRLYGTGNVVDSNILSNNYFAGILVEPTATARFTRNSIFGNGDSASGQIGIDLLSGTQDGLHGTSPFVSPNDAGDGDSGGNGLLNFPVITSATVSGGNLTIQGFAPAGSKVEVFIAAPDASGFGEGKTFAFDFVEGSASDADASTGSYNAASLRALGYSSSVATLAGSETGANKFKVVVPAGSISSTSVITATATLSNQTSEFSPALDLAGRPLPSLSGIVYVDANANGTREQSEAGASLTGFFVKIVLNGATAATSASPVNPDGTYSFSGVSPGDYTLVLDNNATLSDITPTVPAGFSATEAPNGTRASRIGQTALGSENFGLFSGFSLTGRVFEDNGSGGGTANDAQLNGTEPGLGGVQLQLKSGATIVANATTNPDGSYSFAIPASYSGQNLSVVELNPTGFLSSGGSAGNTAGTYNRTTDTLTFAFNTTNGVLTGANFADVKSATLENDGAQTGTRGSAVNYPHIFTAGTPGMVSFATAQNATPAADWTATIYLDANANGKVDAGETPFTSSSAPLSVTAGQVVNLVVINFVPQSAPDGAQDKVTLSANFSPASGGSNPALPVQTLVRNDLTTVGQQNGLLLSKSVDKTSARSGDLITYTISYSNTGNTAISNLIIHDATPAFTTFSSASFAALPNNLTAPVIVAPTVGQSGSLSWKFGGTLAPASSGTVSFVVKLK